MTEVPSIYDFDLREVKRQFPEEGERIIEILEPLISPPCLIGDPRKLVTFHPSLAHQTWGYLVPGIRVDQGRGITGDGLDHFRIKSPMAWPLRDEFWRFGGQMVIKNLQPTVAKSLASALTNILSQIASHFFEAHTVSLVEPMAIIPWARTRDTFYKTILDNFISAVYITCGLIILGDEEEKVKAFEKIIKLYTGSPQVPAYGFDEEGTLLILTKAKD